MIVAGISVVFGGCCLAIAVRLSGWRRAILLAVAVGVLFGVVAKNAILQIDPCSPWFMRK